jgi:hypothetical protein
MIIWPLGAELARERREADRKGEQAVVADRDQRPQERGPVAEEVEDRERGHCGRHQGHRDVPPDLEFIETINSRRVDEIVGHGLEELAHQEHAERRDHAGKHDAPVGVQPAELAPHHVPGDHQHLGRDHQGREDADEHQAAAAEANLHSV